MWWPSLTTVYPFLFFIILMIVITWNCRGAQGKNFRRALKLFCRKHKVDIVALQEPRCSGNVALRTIKSLGFKKYLKLVVFLEEFGYYGIGQIYKFSSFVMILIFSMFKLKIKIMILGCLL
jgi:exonuclease III